MRRRKRKAVKSHPSRNIKREPEARAMLPAVSHLVDQKGAAEVKLKTVLPDGAS